MAETRASSFEQHGASAAKNGDRPPSDEARLAITEVLQTNPQGSRPLRNAKQTVELPSQLQMMKICKTLKSESKRLPRFYGAKNCLEH